MLEARDHPPLDYSDGEPADRATVLIAVALSVTVFSVCHARWCC
jgi:hypothetical protein